jgi:hypothetical protein
LPEPLEQLELFPLADIHKGPEITLKQRVSFMGGMINQQDIEWYFRGYTGTPPTTIIFPAEPFKTYVYGLVRVEEHHKPA